jgi:hypothetical protein
VRRPVQPAMERPASSKFSYGRRCGSTVPYAGINVSIDQEKR